MEKENTGVIIVELGDQRKQSLVAVCKSLDLNISEYIRRLIDQAIADEIERRR